MKNMEITDIRIKKVASEGKMKAVASVTFDNAFAVHDVKVIEGPEKLFVAMPSRRTPDGEYRDIAHPINSDMRNMLESQLKQQTGLTPQRYLNRLRLMKARHLLRHSEASVTDIAYRCGFSDSNHFSTLFRREFNWSPRDIRQGRDGFLQ